MLNKKELMKKWKELSIEDKQKIGMMAGVGAGLLTCLLKKNNKKEEMIKLVVQKDAEIMIFVKGGK